jgi:hypothetical protein
VDRDLVSVGVLHERRVERTQVLLAAAQLAAHRPENYRRETNRSVQADAFSPVETWIPDGSFQLVHRKGKTSEGAVMITEWLVPVWAHDDVTAAHPCAEQPCLQRVLAECRHDQVVSLASRFGLLTATGKAARADALPPEPVDIWHREIRALRNATATWDAIAGEDVTALRHLLPQQRKRWPAAGSNWPRQMRSSCSTTTPRGSSTPSGSSSPAKPPA